MVNSNMIFHRRQSHDNLKSSICTALVRLNDQTNKGLDSQRTAGHSKVSSHLGFWLPKSPTLVMQVTTTASTRHHNSKHSMLVPAGKLRWWSQVQVAPTESLEATMFPYKLIYFKRYLRLVRRLYWVWLPLFVLAGAYTSGKNQQVFRGSTFVNTAYYKVLQQGNAKNGEKVWQWCTSVILEPQRHCFGQIERRLCQLNCVAHPRPWVTCWLAFTSTQECLRTCTHSAEQNTELGHYILDLTFPPAKSALPAMTQYLIF